MWTHETCLEEQSGSINNPEHISINNPEHICAAWICVESEETLITLMGDYTTKFIMEKIEKTTL